MVNNQKSKQLGNILLVFIYTFIILNSFPMFFYENHCNLGSIMLIFGGWFGIISYAYSIKFIKNNNVSNAINGGIAGSILLAINLSFISIAYPESPYYNTYTLLYYFDIISIFVFLAFYGALLYIRNKRDELRDEALIRQTLLNFGTKLTRLKVDEIAERTGAFHRTIIRVIKNMRKNEEIYGRYFKSSNSVVFNQESNIDNYDRLLSVYNEWEKSSIAKKSDTISG